MEILVLLIFIGVVLVVGAGLLFGFSIRNEDFDHADEISILPLEDDEDAEPKNHVR